MSLRFYGNIGNVETNPTYTENPYECSSFNEIQKTNTETPTMNVYTVSAIPHYDESLYVS